MAYCFSAFSSLRFEETIDKVKELLSVEDFGVLSEIDVDKKLKEKLGVEFRRYKILGACNPAFAHKALQAETHIGTMLPCNVVVQEHEDGKVEVSAIDPVASMMAIENPGLADIAAEVRKRLKEVISRVN